MNPPRRTPAPRRGGEPRGASATPQPAPQPAAAPAFAQAWSWRRPILVPLVLLLAGRILMWLSIPTAAEDAFITFRYARNLALGFGLVYNLDRRVMGFSSPLWTLWNALGYLVTRDLVVWSRVWSLAADVVTLLAGVLLLERHATRAAAWCFAFFFAAWPYFAAVSMSGMEISLMLALIVLTAVALDRPRATNGLLLAALVFVRPEGAVAAAVLALRAKLRDRLVALGLVAAGLVALTAYYGNPIPQSLIAKSRVYGLGGPWSGRFWWDWLSPVIFGRWPTLGDTAPLMVQCVVFFPAFALGLRAVWKARHTALAAAAAACLAVWLGYAGLGVSYFWWYLGVPLAGFALVAAAGFPSIVRGRAVMVACTLMILSGWTIMLPLYVGRAQNETYYFGNAAAFLRQSCRPGDKVLLEPIGTIGYFAPLTVIDEIGLVSPQVAERRLHGAGWYADVVQWEKPDWLVIRARVLRSGEAFAGVGAPFRSAGERESALAPYREAYRSGEQGDEDALVILRRAS